MYKSLCELNIGNIKDQGIKRRDVIEAHIIHNGLH